MAKKCNENIDITDLEDFLDYTRQNQSVYQTQSISVANAVAKWIENKN